MIINNAVIGNGNSTAFLTSVLERQKSVVASVRRRNCAVAEYTEDSALFMQTFLCVIIERIIQDFTIRLFL
jgi:hypothetical protein